MLEARSNPDESAQDHFPTRREIRESLAAASGKKLPRVRRSTAARVRVVAAPAYALPKTKTPHKKRFTALVTMVAVTGLFASVSIPAYAITGATGPVAAAADLATGAALSVSADAKLALGERGAFTATTPADLAQQRSNSVRDQNFAAYVKSGAVAAGDDYPWFSELSNNQGGGLSPLNYFYRECVDFVAWRLNRDAGSTTAPFLYDWHNLTPSGGNAYQWKYAWEQHGWPISNVPKVGSVAWFGFHVSYVSAVNPDGTVTLEEYNYASDHLYGVRTIPATDVISYLYAPPR